MYFKVNNKANIISEKHETVLDGQQICYSVRRSYRAKHTRLEVRRETGLTVVIPGNAKLSLIPDLLKSKQHWIIKNLKKYTEDRSEVYRKEIEVGDCVSYLGLHLKVLVRCQTGREPDVKLNGKRLIIDLKYENTRLYPVLEAWYRQQAKTLIQARADVLCPRLGVSYNRLTIRAARTRWGSCSRMGNLNFNWKLMMVPLSVIDYVIIHELAHLKEMNHSKQFWGLVSDHCPQWRRHRKWLKDHEAEISAGISSH